MDTAPATPPRLFALLITALTAPPPECSFFDRLVSKKGSEHDAADSTGIFLNLVHAPAVGALINLGLNLRENVASNAKANHRLG